MAINLVLSVRDTEASLRFYTETLGFQQEGGVLPDPDGKAAFAAVVHNGTMIMLDSTEAPPNGPLGQGVALYVTEPDDFEIDNYYKRLQEKGVKVIHEIREAFWGERLFTIADPDGYALAFAKKIFDASYEDMASQTSKGQAT